MNNHLVRAASMEGVRATITSLDGDADAVFRRAGVADQDLDPQSWHSYNRFQTLHEDAAQATPWPISACCCPARGIMPWGLGKPGRALRLLFAGVVAPTLAGASVCLWTTEITFHRPGYLAC